MKKITAFCCLFISLLSNAQCLQTVAVGNTSMTAIHTDGTLWAWGSNEYGQLGNGTFNSSLVPIQVSTETTFTMISAKGHVAALKQDGTLWAWGLNMFGQLGNGTTNNNNAITQVGTDADWVQVAVGHGNTVTIKADGTLWGCGYNWQHQIYNDGTEAPTPMVTQMMQIGTDTNWQTIAVGDFHIMALKTDGSLWVWGSNSGGQCGQVPFSAEVNQPTQIGTDAWREIAAGSFSSYGIKQDGTLWAWGNNGTGAVGIGPTDSIIVQQPVQVGTDNNWDHIYARANTAFGQKTNGELYGWGYNIWSNLGIGTNENMYLPTLIPDGPEYSMIFTSYENNAAFKNDGTLWLWGNNPDGRLGLGNTGTQPVPVQLECSALLQSGFSGGEVSLYPNPVTDSFEITGLDGLPSKIIITDMYGKIIRAVKDTGSVSLSDVPDGIYIATAYYGGKALRKKIIKAR